METPDAASPDSDPASDIGVAARRHTGDAGGPRHTLIHTETRYPFLAWAMVLSFLLLAVMFVRIDYRMGQQQEKAEERRDQVLSVMCAIGRAAPITLPPDCPPRPGVHP